MVERTHCGLFHGLTHARDVHFLLCLRMRSDSEARRETLSDQSKQAITPKISRFCWILSSILANSRVKYASSNAFCVVLYSL